MLNIPAICPTVVASSSAYTTLERNCIYAISMQAASTSWKLASKWGRTSFSPFIEIFWEDTLLQLKLQTYSYGSFDLQLGG